MDEYENKLKILKRNIKYLELFDIDIDYIKKELIIIENSVSNQSYNECNNKLDILIKETERYNEYLGIFYMINNISNIVDSNKIDNNNLNVLVNNIIYIIDNYSNVLRKDILDKLYYISSKLMYLEVKYNSKSRIILYSKQNSNLKAYLINILRKDIIVSDKVESNKCDIIHDCLDSIGEDVLKEDIIINYTEDNLEEKVMEELKNYLNLINSNNKEIEKLIKKRRRLPVVTTLITFLSVLTTIITIAKVSNDKSNTLEYLTTETVYVDDNYSISQKYMPYIENGYQKLVIDTYPWSKVNDKEYTKKTVSYDVTSSNIDESNYENIDVSNYKSTTSVKKNVGNNIYLDNDTIRSLVTLVQDSDDIRTDFDYLTFTIYIVIGSLSGILELLLAGTIYEAVSHEYISELIKEFYDRIKYGNLTYEEINEINIKSKRYLKLINENEELKERFIKRYNEFKNIIDIDKLNNEYKRIMK